MKSLAKFISASLLLLSTAQTSIAQETTSRFIPRIGIKGGLNYSNLFTDNVDDKNQLLGFNAGLFVKMPITRFIAIQPELYYTTKGAELTYNNSVANGTARFRLNYIEVPVLLVININQNFNIHGGPYASYLVDAKATNKSNVGAFDFEKSLNKDDYNRMDAGLMLGAAIDIQKISIGARYSYGMTTVGKERTFGSASYTYPDSKNGVFNIYVALSLN